MILEGQHIVVTGASRGIGLAITHELLAEDAQVVAVFRRDNEEIKALSARYPGQLHTLHADLSAREEAAGLWQKIIQLCPVVSGVVNNAGIALETAIEEEKWLEDWEQTMQVNLHAVGVICRDALLHFKENGGGRIVNIASRAAFRGDTPEYMAYAASKSGLIGLTRSIARGFGKQQIKAFLICPGFVKTDMAQDFIDTYGEAFVTSDLALSDMTLPEHISPTVAFLLSGKADHATGSTIDINAGSYVR